MKIFCRNSYFTLTTKEVAGVFYVVLAAATRQANRMSRKYRKSINHFQYLGLKIYLNFDDIGYSGEHQKKLDSLMEIIIEEEVINV